MTSSSANKQHLNFGHFGAIMLCALVLVFVSWMKSGFHFDFAPSAQSAAPSLTYEQAEAQAVAEVGGSPASNVADAGQTADEVAMLDPSSQNGSVLGTSTDDSALFPPADDIITPAMLDQIKIKAIPDSGADAVTAYSEKVTYVESTFNSLGLLADLNSEDQATLKTAGANANQIVAALGQIPVPNELVQYHKLKMMYYTTIGYLAKNFSGETTNLSVENLSTLMFSLSEKLDALESDMMTKYNVQL